jgi:hypothetical protein
MSKQLHRGSSTVGKACHCSTVEPSPWVVVSMRPTRLAWAGHAACLTATAFGLIVLLGLARGHSTFVGVPNAAYAAGPLLVFSAVLSAATFRPWGWRLPNRLLWLSLSALGLLLVASSCFVLLNLIELALTGGLSGRQGRSDVATFGERLGASLVGWLLLASATAWRRRSSGVCMRCGQPHVTPSFGIVQPAPSAASVRVRRLAWLGCAAFLPYLAFHGLHATGFLPSQDTLYDRPILPGSQSVQFALFATFLIGPAVFLLAGLVGRWGMQFPVWLPGLGGQRVPRWLPLTPVGLIAPTLVLYGWGSMVYALLNGYSVLGLGGAASLAFGGYGTALAVAATSYLQRTRPRCRTADSTQNRGA